MEPQSEGDWQLFCVSAICEQSHQLLSPSHQAAWRWSCSPFQPCVGLQPCPSHHWTALWSWPWWRVWNLIDWLLLWTGVFYTGKKLRLGTHTAIISVCYLCKKTLGSQKSCWLIGDQILISLFFQNANQFITFLMRISVFLLLLLFCYSVSHCLNKPTIKIIDRSFIFQWANVQSISNIFCPTVVQITGCQCSLQLICKAFLDLNVFICPWVYVCFHVYFL